ncbi:MAG: hypothetical protein ABMA13_01780 [Chthoniobacteraceae bacterium]
MLRRALGILSVFVAALHAADLPEPRLDTVFPPGGKTGSEVEVAITGANIDGMNAMHFTHAGITAVAKDKRFIVKIAPGVPAGIYDARVSGPLGVSSPRAFVVGTLPESVKAKPHSAIESAVDLAPDTVFNGAATAATADYFRFGAKRNQRVIIECAGIEIDSRIKSVISVLDPAGRELATSRIGGVLDFTAPVEGPFLVKLHDLTFAGGPEHFYRLAIRTGPRIDYVLPSSAEPGKRAKFTLHGRNLPDGGKLEVEIDVPAKGDSRVDGLSSPAAAVVDGFSYRHGDANPVFISFATAPVVAERASGEEPRKVTPPCEITGQFFPAGDVDRFAFDAKKGEVWRIEVFSHRLGVATNPFLLVQRDAADVQEVYASATNVGGQKFSTLSNDPAWRFEVKEDGAYRVTVRDLSGGARSDPRSIYRLSIRKEVADFRLVALVEPALEKKDDRAATPRTPLLRAGGTIAVKVLALRQDGFAGDIDLLAEGLPPGVSFAPAKITAGKSEGVLLLSVVEKPAAWTGGIRIVGKSGDLVHEARGGVVRWPVVDFNLDGVQARLSRDIALAVCATEETPIRIDATEAKPGEIVLKVTRTAGFKEALKLSANIAGVKEVDVAPTAATATASVGKLPAGEHTIYFSAQTKGKFRGKDVVTTIYSTPIKIVVPPKP